MGAAPASSGGWPWRAGGCGFPRRQTRILFANALDDGGADVAAFQLPANRRHDALDVHDVPVAVEQQLQHDEILG